jgi:hypothetical protein
MWGSLLDHVVEVRAVIANSSIVTASEKENPDLFWALKGAGSSFAIVTSFKLRTQEAPGQMVNYKFAFDFSDWSNIARNFKAWQNFVSQPDLSRKFASLFMLSPIGMIVTGTYFGPKAEFEALKMREIFPSQGTNTTIKVMENWLGTVAQWGEDLVLQSIGGLSASFYANSLAFTKNDLIPDKGVDNLFQHLKTPKGTPIWFTVFDLQGGAINDIAPNATAFAHRDVLFYMQSYAVGIGGVSNTTMKFVTGLNKVVTESLGGKDLGAYAGYIDPQLRDPQLAYFNSNLPRLKQIKKEWDPQNVFKNPQGIKPIR